MCKSIAFICLFPPLLSLSLLPVSCNFLKTLLVRRELALLQHAKLFIADQNYVTSSDLSAKVINGYYYLFPCKKVLSFLHSKAFNIFLLVKLNYDWIFLAFQFLEVWLIFLGGIQSIHCTPAISKPTMPFELCIGFHTFFSKMLASQIRRVIYAGE